ncbi:type I restriction endonuclease subunit R [Xenorhabdus szentirmaii]|uniref:type I restriction endonuclease subunit R n=1 Tax=Xenorhabdus szentirmaii TaxID=290112 RepID=UPI0019BBD3B5|nr:type I restriction endonuclease subunit R [Xenorhabdus sp. 38]MBD2780913.1 type I restriction endonuclease subunit R [Xenorhabdus sp. 38]
MSLKFSEEKLEKAIIELLKEQGYPHKLGENLTRADKEQVIIVDDLRNYLTTRYQADGLTDNEIERIIRQLTTLSASDLYESNKTFCFWLSNGFLFKRDNRAEKDLYIELIDTRHLPAALQQLFISDEVPLQQAAEPTAFYSSTNSNNQFKVANQLEIIGKDNQSRIPDTILYINGLPLVVFEFKSAIRGQKANLDDAWRQICVRYRRDIPQLFVYNAMCIISDGANSRMGNLFAPYEYFYSWRKITGNENLEQEGINSLYSMIRGLFHPIRLLDVIKNFICFPDTSNKEIKICCRYPQYYAARKLYYSIKQARKPHGNGKGGTYFGATGCGKSYTMQFLTRLLMKSVDFASPTIVLITDRTDLDEQLARQFCNATKYIGDNTIVSVKNRQDLREKLAGCNSGGVFLTTIHKFTEDTELLSERNNIICISDEAHRSQINLDQKVLIDNKTGCVRKTYGFAKYLRDSLPSATYVGFTGTPIDATLDVFGEIIDSYTMTESVKDGITVPIVYEGRAAKIILDNSKLEKIEQYYEACAAAGTNDYQIDESKKASATMNAILGDSNRLRALADDFAKHYEKRVAEGSTLKGKAMFVCASRDIAWEFYKQLKAIRPTWFEIQQPSNDIELTPVEKEKLLPSEMVKMIMTRDKDDEKTLYDLLGSKEYRKGLDTQFKNPNSNFKIAIVVDMWVTGFDVPELDTIYIDKPLQKHNLIQTISRVNRSLQGKIKGLVVDYIGIKRQMNQALAMYSKVDSTNFEDVALSIATVKDNIDLLKNVFHKFDSQDYFSGKARAQLECLNRAAEFVLQTKKQEHRFMGLVKRLKAAYDICCGSELLTQEERDHIHFFLAIRSIVFKLTKGDAPDMTQMNAKVREMIADALKSNGVEELYTLGEDKAESIDIFDDDYIDRVNKIKLPNTKIQLLQKLLGKAISEFKKVNQLQGVNFSRRFQAILDSYNERREDDILSGEEFETFSQEMADIIYDIKTEMGTYAEMGIDIEEKAFYDILNHMREKYQFTYDDEKMLILAKEMKLIVDNSAQYPDWSKRDDIKAKLKVDLILLLHKHNFPPIANDEVYYSVLAQAENFKMNRMNQTA